MLLSNNTERVINLINMFDNLNNIDKIRLAIHILEDLGFNTDYDIESIIKLLEEIMVMINPDYKKNITNFGKYKNLLFISAKYMELSTIEKKKYTIELLFNLYETDFDNKIINNKINNQLDIYNYCYYLNV